MLLFHCPCTRGFSGKHRRPISGQDFAVALTKLHIRYYFIEPAHVRRPGKSTLGHAGKNPAADKARCTLILIALHGHVHGHQRRQGDGGILSLSVIFHGVVLTFCRHDVTTCILQQILPIALKSICR